MLPTKQHVFADSGPSHGAGRRSTCGFLGVTNAKRKESRYQKVARPGGKPHGEGVTRRRGRQGTLVAGRRWTSRGKLRGFCQGKSRKKPYAPKRLTVMAPIPGTINSPLYLGGFLILQSVEAPRCDRSTTGRGTRCLNRQMPRRVVPLPLVVFDFLISVLRTQTEARLDAVPR